MLIGFLLEFEECFVFCHQEKLIPHYLLNVVALSIVLLIFVESDVFAHESGLLCSGNGNVFRK